MDSDSDYELLPNVNKLNAMFNQVQREARQETAKLLPSISTKKAEKKSSKEKVSPVNKSTKRSASGEDTSKKAEKKSSKQKVSPVNKSTKRSASGEDTSKNAPKKDLETVNVSEESRKLLEEMDMLTCGFGSSIEPLPSSTQTAPSSINRITGTAKRTKTTSKQSSRRGRKPIPEVHVVDDSEDEGLQCLDATFDDSEEIVAEPVVNELYSLRVRWKNEVLRFKVPSDAKISQIRMDLGERVSIRADDLLILDEENNEEIPDNTPVTEIPFEKTLEAYQREESTASNGNIKPKNVDRNFVVIKLQGCGGYKERYTVVIKRTTHVKQLIDDYVEKFNHHGKKFKLQFDGEDIDSSETPESLDLENDDMIDVREV